MAYFRNTTVNLLNLHYGIHAIALSGGGAFFAAYLLKAGLPVPGIFLALGGILLGRFIFRPMAVGLSVCFGLRALVVAGTLFSALQYPLLAEVHGLGAWLFALCAMAALGDTLYWTTYHAYFAKLGDDEHRGHQVGAREAIAALVGIASPLATGWMLVAFGPQTAFGATGLVVAAAALPLLGTPDVKVASVVPGAFKAALPGVLFFVGDGLSAVGYVMVWQVALFLSLNENVVAFGGALALSALVGAVGGLFLGRHIDGGHGGRAAWIAIGVTGAITLLRAAAIHNATLAVLANAVGALGGCLYTPTLMTAVYTLAKRAPCALRFQVAMEGGWDIGGGAGLLLAALLAWWGVSLSVSILLSLAGLALVFALLRRYYATHLVVETIATDMARAGKEPL